MSQAPDQRRNPNTGEWEVLVNGAWEPASDSMALRLDMAELEEGGVASGGGTTAEELGDVLVDFFSRSNQGNGADTEQKAHDLALSAGLKNLAEKIRK